MNRALLLQTRSASPMTLLTVAFPTIIARVAYTRKRACSSPSAVNYARANSSLVAGLASESTINHEYPPPPAMPSVQLPNVEPSTPVAQEMKTISRNVQNLLGSGHPILNRLAKYYVQGGGKHLRPMIVLLMSRAINDAPKMPGWIPRTETENMVNESIAPLGILKDLNPDLINLINDQKLIQQIEQSPILQSQKRLAEIAEMIHAASLLHDDVLDEAEIRRGRDSANLVFGNKMAVLAGDFLLSRASVALARIRVPEVVEIISTVIANLVEGEFMQLENSSTDVNSPEFRAQTMEYYLQKSYLKTASLMSKCCRGAAILAGSTEEVVNAAYAYGKNLGLAFQLIDDVLDFTVSDAELGKPSGADLKLGIATAPVIFAFEKFPELGPMMERKFTELGDVERAHQFVIESDGVAKTRQLAEKFSQAAIDAISIFPETEARISLEVLAKKALKRRK